MEWTNRNNDNSAAPAQSAAGAAPGTRHRAGDKAGMFKGLRLATVALLFSVTVLIVALAWFVAIGGSTGESKYVQKNQMQAVFLNGGQVYFGHITNLNDKYMRVADIYYLRVNQTVQPNQQNASGAANPANDISLVKLGCELHGPDDNMLINRDQIIFWENLKSDGQVAQAVDKYKKDNPNGQKCEAPNANATTPTTTTTPSPTTPSTTKKQ